MRVTPPVSITPAKLTSSTATDIHAPAAYSAGTTYGFGAIASVAADYAIYESLQAGNTGRTPLSEPLWWRKLGATETAYSAATTYPLGATVSGSQRVYESLQPGNVGKPLPVLPETETAWWLDVGPTNKWAMFDLSANTQTVVASPMTVVFRPGERVNTLGLTGLQANSATISATSVFGGGSVYGPFVIDLNTRAVADGYDYAFEPFSTKPSLALFDLPPYSDIIITVVLSATSGNVKCGSAVVGTYIYLGAAQYDAESDALNFSTIDRDLYGNATLVPRRTVPKTNQTLKAPAARANKIRAARVLMNAVPGLYTGLDDPASDWFDTLCLIGIYKTFRIRATPDRQATITLDIEEI